MWTALNQNKCHCAVAISNFNGKLKYGLSISIGDIVRLYEECNGWYRGVSLRTKQQGIFPASYVVLRNYELDSDGPDAVPVLVEDVIVSEVRYVLREWNNIIKKLFLKNKRSLIVEIISAMSELVNYRQQLSSGTLTQNQIHEINSKVTKRIDWGNKRLALDLVPRVDNQPVDVNKTNPIELFLIHEESSLNSRDSKQTKLHTSSVITTHHLLVGFNAISCSIGEEAEFHFALYDSLTNKFFSERFLLKLSRQGNFIDCERPSLVTVFTDLGERDLSRDVYLVGHMFRLGSLKDGGSTSKTPTMAYKRPYGCGVQNISSILKDDNNESQKELNFNLKVVPCSESDFPQLHEHMIKKQQTSSSNVKLTNIEIRISVKLFHGELETLKAKEPHSFKHAVITNKLGFSDVIMPDTDRNDLFLTLERAEFERGSKTAQKNIEARLSVLTKDGTQVTSCISRGSGEPDITEYNSFVYYHNNNPRWNDTIRLRIPVDQFYSSHVRIEFRHCSCKDKTEKKVLGMCFVKIITDEFTTLADGPRELCFYKCDDVRKLRDHREYINLPDISVEPVTTSTGSSGSSAIRRSDKEAVFIQTLHCSTKFTQNATLLGVLKWKMEPFKIAEYLNKLILQDGEEIVKFLQYIMDALFDMMSPGNGFQIRPQCIFKALIHIFYLLKDKKFERFIPVMDAYIANNFSAPLVFRELSKCLREMLDAITATGTPANSQTRLQSNLLEELQQTIASDISSGLPPLQHQMSKCVMVLRDIVKCIVQSRLLYMDCPKPGDREKDEFADIIRDLFTTISQVLCVDNVIILKLQIPLLHQIPGLLQELQRMISPVNLCQTFSKLISSVANVHQTELVFGKLISMKKFAESSLFSVYECKTILVPVFVCELSHCCRHEQDTRAVAEILFAMLSSLHCDQKLNVTLEPNLSVILDGLLEEILNFVDVDNTKPIPSHLVACLTSMLKMMDEVHFRQLLVRYEEKRQTEIFLGKLLVTFQILIKQEVYPKDWFSMTMATNQVLLQTVKLVSLVLTEKFLHQKCFVRMLWANYFHFAVTFITQSSLQLEIFSTAKMHKIRKKYGDLRLKMGNELLEKWQSLKDKQIHFIPEFVGPFLEVTMVPERSLRQASIPVFFDMMLREWENNKNFSKLENELINKLDILLTENRGDDEFKNLFHSVLMGKLKRDAEWSQSWKISIESVTSLLERLLDYRNVLTFEDNLEKRMKCIYNLLNYYHREDRWQEMYILYVYKLCDLHRECGNHTEAALTLKLHSDQLTWSNKMMPPFGNSYPAQFEWQRTESLYLRIIAEFDSGKTWEYGLPFCEKLAEVYKEKIMFAKLSELLKTEAEFYRRILDRYSLEPTYFLVRFYGQGFSSFLRSKEFIYRGNELEKLNAFQYRFLLEFSGAVVLESMNTPKDDIINSPRQYLQICIVMPLADIDGRFLAQGIPEPVRSFYKVNNVCKFYVDRPYHSGNKDDNNDFKTLHCDRTLLTTSSSFPGVMRWFEVTNRQTITLTPIEVALDGTEKTNQKLSFLVMQYTDNPGQNLGPLTMNLQGVIDPAVQGGFPKYQQAFFNDKFQKENPQHAVNLLKLIELFNDQVAILEQAMHLHKHLASLQIQPLQKHLEERFTQLKQNINKSSAMVGYDRKQGRKSEESDLFPRRSDGSRSSSGSLRSSNKSSSSDSTILLSEVGQEDVKKDSSGVLRDVITKFLPRRESKASLSTSPGSTTWYPEQKTLTHTNSIFPPKTGEMSNNEMMQQHSSNISGEQTTHQKLQTMTSSSNSKFYVQGRDNDGSTFDGEQRQNTPKIPERSVLSDFNNKLTTISQNNFADRNNGSKQISECVELKPDLPPPRANPARKSQETTTPPLPARPTSGGLANPVKPPSPVHSSGNTEEIITPPLPVKSSLSYQISGSTTTLKPPSPPVLASRTSPAIHSRAPPSPVLPLRSPSSPALSSRASPSPTLPSRASPSPPLSSRASPSAALPSRAPPSPALSSRAPPSPVLPSGSSLLVKNNEIKSPEEKLSDPDAANIDEENLTLSSTDSLHKDAHPSAAAAAVSSSSVPAGGTNLPTTSMSAEGDSKQNPRIGARPFIPPRSSVVPIPLSRTLSSSSIQQQPSSTPTKNTVVPHEITSQSSDPLVSPSSDTDAAVETSLPGVTTLAPKPSVKGRGSNISARMQMFNQ